jgi:hypothetical protein
VENDGKCRAGQVVCHSGSEYAERPIALYWQENRLEINEIIARWREPAGKRFRVSTTAGQAFELFYVEASGEWQIEPF